MDKLSHKARSIARRVGIHDIHFNFYRAHLSFFVISILVASTIFWASSTHGFHVSYTDALTMCASAMTNCGLTTINLSATNAYQQSILFVLMLLGDLSIASVSIVYVRRYLFSKKIHRLLRHSKAARRLARDVEEQRNRRQSNETDIDAEASSSSVGSSAPSTTSIKQRAQASDPSKTSSLSRNDVEYSSRRRLHGYGGVPSFWQIITFDWLTNSLSKIFGDLSPPDHHYLSFLPELDSRGRFHNLTGEQLEELGGVEYRALNFLSWYLPAYTILWLCLSWTILLPYSMKSSISSVIRTAQPGNTNPRWWALFIGLSSYSNAGLNLLDQNMIPFNHDYLILTTTGATILAGNTIYPIFLRLGIWSLSKVVPRKSAIHHSLAFLLHHPRRCFLFLFPGKNTWYLLSVQAIVFLLLWAAFEVLNLGFTPLTSQFKDHGQRVMDGLYQAHGVRSSGFYITSPSNLSPACQIFYMVNMYISAIPFIVSLRSTNIYEEQSIGVESDKEKYREPDKPAQHRRQNGSVTGIQVHLQNQLAYDLWWISLAVFLITIIERDPIATSAPGFSIFSVIFEVISAYGTVGLSLGLPYANTSFCGAWQNLSKVILIAVMLRGRHRILPLAIDRAVMLPGEELMEKFDEEYMLRPSETKRSVWKRYEEEIREEEKGKQAEHGGKQDPESHRRRPEQRDYGSFGQNK